MRAFRPTLAALEPRRLCNAADGPIATVTVQVFVPVGTGGFYVPVTLQPAYPPATDPTYVRPPNSVAG